MQFPPFWGAGFPFFFGRRRRRLNTISGIPVLRTTGVVTTSTEVRYDVNYSVITDTNLGLTISTDKQEIVNILRNQYNTYKARKESIAKCDEEMSKCQALLEKLDIPKEPTNTEDPRIKELQDEVNELKNIIKQASSMVPPPMKQMLPQNMQNVMKEVDQ